MKLGTLFNLALMLLSSNALAKPLSQPHALLTREDCLPRLQVVESCFLCEDGDYENCGEPDGTGRRICSCSQCKYACFFDPVAKREPTPLPELASLPSCDTCTQGVNEVCTRSNPPICSCLVTGEQCIGPTAGKRQTLPSCSTCPDGVSSVCTKSIPPQCSCLGTGTRCVDDGVAKRGPDAEAQGESE